MKEQEIFKLLEDADWEGIYRRLLAFTIRVAGNLAWRGVRGVSGVEGELTGGVSCKDLVQDVIQKTLTGQRKWDSEKGELEPWLRQQIKSEINHLVESATHAHEREELGEEIDTSGSVSSKPASVAAYTQDPATVVLQRTEIAEKITAIYEAAEADPELEAIIEAVIDGCEPKPRYLAEELQTTVTDINNRIRKLRRRVVRDDLS